MKILGHEFKPMTSDDWQTFAGAEPDSLICHVDGVTLVWDPKSETLSEVYCVDNGPAGDEFDAKQRDWNFKQVIG